jgi:hypothetical protein
LVKDIIELNQSPWSGHSALMGKVKRKWQNSEYVLSFFGQNRYRRGQKKMAEQRICIIFFWSKSLSPQKLSAICPKGGGIGTTAGTGWRWIG